MNGSARSRRERRKDWSAVGVRGKMKLSVIVYNSAKVPNVATVFSNRYSGRILKISEYKHQRSTIPDTYLSVVGYSSSYTSVGTSM